MSVKIPRFLQTLLDSPGVERLVRPKYPPFAVDVSSERLVAVALSSDRRGWNLEEHRVVELAPGVVKPSLLRPAVLDLAAFRDALRRATEDLPRFEGRLSLVLPDHMSKISFEDLEEGSPYSAETAELIRWKLKKKTPFRVEDARISHHPFPRPAGGHRCLVSMMQKQVITQFEEVCRELGYELGLIDLASFNLWNLVEPMVSLAEGDSLVINVDDGYGTSLIARDGLPVFVRCKAPAGTETVSWEEFRDELHPTLLYYGDRLGGAGLRRAVIRAPADVAAQLAKTLQASAIPVEELRVEVHGTESLGHDQCSRLAPAIGAAKGR